MSTMVKLVFRYQDVAGTYHVRIVGAQGFFAIESAVEHVVDELVAEIGDQGDGGDWVRNCLVSAHILSVSEASAIKPSLRPVKDGAVGTEIK